MAGFHGTACSATEMLVCDYDELLDTPTSPTFATCIRNERVCLSLMEHGSAVALHSM